MKAQRRHDLQRNELYAELGKIVGFLRKWRAYIVWGLALGLLAVLAVLYMVRSAENKRRALYNTYERLTLDPAVTPQAFLDGMRSLADGRDRYLAATANVQVGNHYFGRFLAAGGMTADPRQKDLADQATAYFRRALRDFPDQPLAGAQAHIGLAKLAESQGDFSAAAAEYQAVTTMKDVSGQPVVVEAQQGLSRLDEIKGPVRMATTSSAPAATAPAAAQPAAGGAAAKKPPPAARK